MAALDVDAATLETIAAASAHAFEQAIVHVEAEIKAADGNYEPLLATLTDDGPYAYTIIPEVRPDGSVKLPILTTREQIAEAYAMIRGASDLLEVIGLTEFRGSWYLFQDAVAKGRRKGADEISDNYTLGLFPPAGARASPGNSCGSGRARCSALPTSRTSEQTIRWRHGGTSSTGTRATSKRSGPTTSTGSSRSLHDGVASAVRDYVDDTGTLTQLEGKDAHREYYEAFFRKYEVRSVQPLVHHTEDRYVFAELRMTVAPRQDAGSSETLTFHTAEFFIPSKDGRFIARIGHGTEPVA